MIVALIDYGSGNLRSAQKALERVAREQSLSCDIAVTADPALVARADRIVLPGVGAFGDCRAGVGAIDGMLEALGRSVIEKARPFLGICVGMQLMADRGLEHGTHPGFGWIGGQVVPLALDDPNLKIPHMGWNDLEPHGHHPVLKGVNPGDHAYFVHSFGFELARAETLLASVSYGQTIPAVIGRDNLVGTQFHPEKSQETGLRLLANFLAWAP